MKKKIILIKIMSLVEDLIFGFHVYIISSFLLNVGISLKCKEMEEDKKPKYIKDENDKLKDYKIYKVDDCRKSCILVCPFIFKKVFISCNNDINSRFCFYHELGHIITMNRYIIYKIFISLPQLYNKYLSYFFLLRYFNISEEFYCDIYATLRMVDFDINKLTLFNHKVNSSNLMLYIFGYTFDTHPVNSFRLEIIKDVLENGELYCNYLTNYLTKDERQKVLINECFKKEKHPNKINEFF